MKREEVLKRPAYWFEHEQNELFRQVTQYMEAEGINRSELAARLNVSKGYISQILNGNFNYTLKKWIELCLAIGVVPAGYKSLDEVIQNETKQRVYEKLPKFTINNNDLLNMITQSGSNSDVLISDIQPITFPDQAKVIDFNSYSETRASSSSHQGKIPQQA